MRTHLALRPNLGSIAGSAVARSCVVCLALGLLALTATACGPAPINGPPTAPAWTPISLGPTSTSAPAGSPPPAVTPAPSLVPLAPVSDADWSIGPKDAPVSFVMYSDFQSPACQKLDAVIRQLIGLHPDEIRFVYRPFPSRAAPRQGRARR